MNLQLPTEAAHCENCAAPYPATLPECPECRPQACDCVDGWRNPPNAECEACGGRGMLPTDRPMDRLVVRRVSTGQILETREWGAS